MRRWFQFSLTTFLLLVALVALWLGSSVQLVREREELKKLHPAIFAGRSATPPARPQKPLPRGLWLLRADRVEEIDYQSRDLTPDELRRVERAFPEACVSQVVFF